MSQERNLAKHRLPARHCNDMSAGGQFHGAMSGRTGPARLHHLAFLHYMYGVAVIGHWAANGIESMLAAFSKFLPSPRVSDDEDNIELDDAADADFASPGAEHRHGKRYKSKES